MEPLKVSNALQVTLNTSAYQKKLLLALSLSIFPFSSYVFAMPLLLRDDPSSSNITNEFILITKDYPIRAHIKYSCYLMIPLGALFFSYLSDLLGRQKTIKNLLMWNIVFRVFASISLTTNVLVLCSIFLGSFSLAGVILCFLYINESSPKEKHVFNSGVLMGCLYFCLVLLNALFYFQVNWRMIIGLDGLFAFFALYFIDKAFESVEWNFFKYGSLKTEMILMKIAGINQVFENVELEENEDDIGLGIGINSRFFILIGEWISFSMISCLMMNEAYDEENQWKVSASLISLISLVIAISKPEVPLKYFRLILVASRVFLISLYLDLIPEVFWPIVQFLLPLEFLFLQRKTHEISKKQKASFHSFLVLFSFLTSYLLTSNLSSHPIALTLIISMLLLNSLITPS